MFSADLSHRYNIKKYPTLKMFRAGEPVKREYRGQRSVKSLVDFVRHQLKDPVINLTNEDELNGVHRVWNYKYFLIFAIRLYFLMLQFFLYILIQIHLSDYNMLCRFKSTPTNGTWFTAPSHPWVTTRALWTWVCSLVWTWICDRLYSRYRADMDLKWIKRNHWVTVCFFTCSVTDKHLLDDLFEYYIQ